MALRAISKSTSSGTRAAHSNSIFAPYMLKLRTTQAIVELRPLTAVIDAVSGKLPAIQHHQSSMRLTIW
jgi:hypothetical protein